MFVKSNFESSLLNRYYYYFYLLPLCTSKFNHLFLMHIITTDDNAGSLKQLLLLLLWEEKSKRHRITVHYHDLEREKVVVRRFHHRKSRGVPCSCGTEFGLNRNDRCLFVVNSGSRGLSVFFVYTGKCRCYEHRGGQPACVQATGRVDKTVQVSSPPLCRAK